MIPVLIFLKSLKKNDFCEFFNLIFDYFYKNYKLRSILLSKNEYLKYTAIVKRSNDRSNQFNLPKK